jgi:hypothetical protein
MCSGLQQERPSESARPRSNYASEHGAVSRSIALQPCCLGSVAQTPKAQLATVVTPPNLQVPIVSKDNAVGDCGPGPPPRRRYLALLR